MLNSIPFDRLLWLVPIVLTAHNLVFRRAFDENIMDWPQFWIMLAFAPLAMVTIAFISLQIGGALDRKCRAPGRRDARLPGY